MAKPAKVRRRSTRTTAKPVKPQRAKATKRATAERSAKAKPASKPTRPPARTDASPTRSIELVARLTEFTMCHETSLSGLLWLPGDRIVAATDGTLTFWDLKTEKRVHELDADSIRHLAASADATIAVSGSEEGAVRLWDLGARAELGTLGKHALGPDNERVYVSAVAISADGRVAVSSGYDRTLRIWDVGARTLRHAVVLPDMAYGCTISPDGTMAAAGGSDKTLRFVDTATGAIVRTCEKLADFISSVAWSPTGAHVASTSDGPQAELWDPATGALVGKWKVPGQTRECGFFRDGTRMWTTGRDLVSIYDVPSATPRGELVSPKAHWVALAPDGSARIAHGGGDGRIRIGVPVIDKLRTIESITDEEADKGDYATPLMSCAWSRDGTRLVAAGEHGKLWMFDPTSGERLWRAGIEDAGLFATAIAPSGSSVLTGSNDCHVTLWDAATGERRRDLVGHETMINDCLFTSETTAITAGDDLIVAWDLNAGTPEARSTDELGGNAIVLSPNGKLLYAGGEDAVVRVHDATTLAVLRSFDDGGHDGAIRALAISPDGTRLVSGSVDQTVRVWDTATGACLHVLVAHQGPVRGVAFLPDGIRALSGSSDNTIRVWETRTGVVLAVLEGHRQFVSWIRVSPDGTKAASTGGDGTVVLWDLTALPRDPVVERPAPDSAPLTAIAYSADGNTLYAGTEKGLVRVWNAVTHAQKPPLRGGRFEVEALAVSPNGRHVATAVEQGVYLWTDGVVAQLSDDWGFSAVAFDAASTGLVAFGRRLHRWGLPAGSPLGTADPKGRAEAIAFTSDTQTAAICDGERLRVVNTATGKARFSQLELGVEGKRVAFATDATAVVVAEGKLVVVDLARERVGRSMKLVDEGGDPREVDAIATTRDGRFVVLLANLHLVVVDLKSLVVVADRLLPHADYPVKALACGLDTVAVTTGRGDVVIYRLR